MGRRNPNQAILTKPPSIEKIAATIRKLKNERAPGPDNLAAELLKVNLPLLATLLYPLIVDAWTNCHISDTWKERVIITISKKGNLSDCRNWR